MADGILKPCNVARSWHWFRHCTLQCGMWLWNRDSEFTKWQHPAMWHVALKSWHWIRQLAAPCNVAGGSGMTCHWIRPNVRHIGILHLVSISTTLLQSTCHSAPVSEILSKSDHPRQKKWRHVDFQDGGSQLSWIFENLTPCSVARSWHWFRHCTLQCGMWLWNRDSEFTKWQHSAMWYVALGWHAVEFAQWQHPAMWQVALGWHAIERQTSAILEFYIWFRFWPHYCSRHVILHQSLKFYPNQTTLGRKKWRHVDFQDGGYQPSWILGI